MKPRPLQRCVSMLQTESLRKQCFQPPWHMRNSENPLHSQSVRPAPFGVCDGLRALPATAWRDLTSVIGIRKAGPGTASCLRGCRLPWFLWESRYEACEQHLSAIRSVRTCRSFGGGRSTQFDSDYSVEDEASPNSFFSQVRCGFCSPRG